MITNQGYTRRTFQEILNSKIQKAKELFGEDIDTSDTTPLGKFIRINAYDQSETEEEAEKIYYSIFPNTAVGTSLDRLCTFVNITRNPATSSRYSVTLKGTSGEIVPIGFLVSTESGIQFYNTQDTVIDSDGKCTIIAECTTQGVIGNVSSSDISVIVNPDATIESIQSVSLDSLGTDIESDVELRNRFMSARDGLGSCNETAISSALLRVETVTSASVVVNDSDLTDENGRPPHSFECYISGGEQHHEEIAQMIFNKKPLGIKTFGNVTQKILDEGGHEHTIKFSHTNYINIDIAVKIKIDVNYEGETGASEIENNIETYINGLGVGKDVIISALYGQIHSVNGVVEVTELKLSVDGSTYTSSNIDIDIYEIARCQNVTVTVVTS